MAPKKLQYLPSYHDYFSWLTSEAKNSSKRHILETCGLQKQPNHMTSSCFGNTVDIELMTQGKNVRVWLIQLWYPWTLYRPWLIDYGRMCAYQVWSSLTEVEKSRVHMQVLTPEYFLGGWWVQVSSPTFKVGISVTNYVRKVWGDLLVKHTGLQRGSFRNKLHEKKQTNKQTNKIHRKIR